MTEQTLDEVLDIIHDIALKLMIRDDLLPEVERDWELIHALARHKFDIRDKQTRVQQESEKLEDEQMKILLS